LEILTRDEYIQRLVCVDRREFIDENQYSDEYFSMDSACCGLHYQKNGIVQINGLFSLLRGDGARMIKELKKRHKYLRLNCLGTNLEGYYSRLGFKTYLALGLYKEMLFTKISDDD